MKLLHYYDEEFVYNPDTVYFQIHPIKPAGFYLSVGTAWEEWCGSNEFPCPKKKREFDVLPEAKLLIINSISKVREVTQRYLRSGSGFLDWDAIAKEYDGVSFENYNKVKKDMYLNMMIMECVWFTVIDAPCIVVWNGKILHEKF